jgi:hypothetical protein
MEFVKTYDKSETPVVFIISNPSGLALSILENLLSNFCSVVVFSKDQKTWRGITSHIINPERLLFSSPTDLRKRQKPDYFLYIDLAPTNLKNLIKEALLLSSTLEAKGLLITSKKYLSEDGLGPRLADTVGIVYLGDFIGPRINYQDGGRISEILSSALAGIKTLLPIKEKIYPVLLSDAAKLISQWLFSFGPYGSEVSVTTKEINIEEIAQAIKNLVPQFRYSLINKKDEEVPRRKIKAVYVNTNLEASLKETIDWFQNNTQPKVVKTRHLGVLWVTLAILVLPLVTMAFSLGLLLLSKTFIYRGDINLTKSAAGFSVSFATITNFQSGVLGKIPLLGLTYRPLNTFSYIMKRLGEAELEAINIFQEISSLLGKILADEEYDISDYSDKIAAEIEFMETQISFLQGELKAYPSLYNKIDAEKLKKIVVESKNLVSILPDVLGKNAKKTYLVLFQNNMELRPTGGFIGSFALVTFTSGKLTDINIQDVYAADGQLKGHVEPPPPIRKYLNQANWFLRDSNWDVDFPTAAKRAEWFLDKEIDVPVDGVIAVDLNLIKDILMETGPIYLDDYQMEISKDNLYEKTQGQVEENFFPGSSKKASFLTALSRDLLTKLTDEYGQNSVKLTKVIYQNLEGKHLQVFLHNTLGQKALGNLGWDGSFNTPDCSGNCYVDPLGLIEANLGVNKANYFIKRNYLLNISAENGEVLKNLTVVYENTANPAIGNAGIYKNYLRVVVPSTSFEESIALGSENVSPDETVNSGRKELGLYFEVIPGQKKELRVSWRNSTDLDWQKSGSYQLFWRKQAGMGDDPVNVSLTGQRAFGYNSLFLKDITSKISW